jgi:hypothetical protein
MTRALQIVVFMLSTGVIAAAAGMWIAARLTTAEGLAAVGTTIVVGAAAGVVAIVAALFTAIRLPPRSLRLAAAAAGLPAAFVLIVLYRVARAHL